jgi:hypothetical protein
VPETPLFAIGEKPICVRYSCTSNGVVCGGILTDAVMVLVVPLFKKEIVGVYGPFIIGLSLNSKFNRYKKRHGEPCLLKEVNF